MVSDCLFFKSWNKKLVFSINRLDFLLKKKLKYTPLI